MAGTSGSSPAVVVGAAGATAATSGSPSSPAVLVAIFDAAAG